MAVFSQCNMLAAVGAALLHDGPVASSSATAARMYSPQALWSAARYRTNVLFSSSTTAATGCCRTLRASWAAQTRYWSIHRHGRSTTRDSLTGIGCINGCSGGSCRCSRRDLGRDCWKRSDAMATLIEIAVK